MFGSPLESLSKNLLKRERLHQHHRQPEWFVVVVDALGVKAICYSDRELDGFSRIFHSWTCGSQCHRNLSSDFCAFETRIRCFLVGVACHFLCHLRRSVGEMDEPFGRLEPKSTEEKEALEVAELLESLPPHHLKVRDVELMSWWKVESTLFRAAKKLYDPRFRCSLSRAVIL